MEKMRKKENEYLHGLKGLACIFIIFAHFPVSGMKGSALNALAHLAVLFFFIICGKYLSLPKENADKGEVTACRKKNLCKTWNLVKTTLGVVTVYTFSSFVFQVVLGYHSFFEWVEMKYSLKEWVQQLFFNAGKIIYDELFYVDHLWYMFAVIYVLLIVCIAIKYMSIRTSIIFMLPLVLQLFMMYFVNVPERVGLFGVMIEGRVLTRNFFVIGMPFIGFGMLLQQIEKNEGYVAFFKQRSIKVILLCMACFGMGMMFFDCARIGSRDLYFGTVIAAFAIAALSLSVSGCRIPGITGLGKYLSGDIYFWHPLVGVILMRTVLRERFGDWFTVLVLVLTVLLAVFLWLVKKYMDAKDRKAICLMAAGVLVCFLFCVGFYQSGMRVEEETLEGVTELESSEKVLFFVKEICYNQKGDAMIYAWSKNGNIHYPFHNWTLDDSDEEYKIAQIVLTDGEDVVYALKTYPYKMGTEGIESDWVLDPKDGCVAYVKKEYCQKDDLSIAVIFTDREGNKYIVYQEEKYEKSL